MRIRFCVVVSVGLVIIFSPSWATSSSANKLRSTPAASNDDTVASIPHEFLPLSVLLVMEAQSIMSDHVVLVHLNTPGGESIYSPIVGIQGSRCVLPNHCCILDDSFLQHEFYHNLSATCMEPSAATDDNNMNKDTADECIDEALKQECYVKIQMQNNMLLTISPEGYNVTDKDGGGVVEFRNGHASSADTADYKTVNGERQLQSQGAVVVTPYKARRYGGRCSLHTGIYGNYNPCDTPAVVAGRFPQAARLYPGRGGGFGFGSFGQTFPISGMNF